MLAHLVANCETTDHVHTEIRFRSAAETSEHGWRRLGAFGARGRRSILRDDVNTVPAGEWRYQQFSAGPQYLPA